MLVIEVDQQRVWVGTAYLDGVLLIFVAIHNAWRVRLLLRIVASPDQAWWFKTYQRSASADN